MTLISGHRRARRLASCGIATITALLLIHPIAAGASVNEYEGKNLAGHTWTTNGIVQPKLVISEAWANTTSSVCAGPVTHDAAGYHFPYGWSCSPESVFWYLPAEIQAASGIYNPNAGTFLKWHARGVSE